MKTAADVFAEYAQYSDRFLRYVNTLKMSSYNWYPDKLQELADRRHFSVELLKSLDIFYIGEMSEMISPDFVDMISDFGVISATNGMPIFNDRYIMPIKDYAGNIINLVGYSWKEDVRYVYGTGRYYERSNDFYGAEKLADCYRDGWCILVEGLTDRMSLLNIGTNNVLSSCGTVDSPLKMEQLSRLEYGVIFIHDRDSAGDETRKHWVVPRAVRLNIANGEKDIDAYLNGSKNNPLTDEERAIRADYVRQSIDACVDWLKQGNCRRGNMNRPSINNCILF